jgi:hypothetical protein
MARGVAMLPGPTTIKRCSACSNLIGEATTCSWNTLGAIYWTDGKLEAPNLPDEPWLARCPHCHAMLWFDELEECGRQGSCFEEVEASEYLGRTRGERAETDLATETPQNPGEKLRGWRLVERPSRDELWNFLEQNSFDPVKQRYLHVMAWWASNDDRRHGAREQAMTDREVANLERLLVILDPSDEGSLVMKAEALRELGRFEAATALLAGRPFRSAMMPAVRAIKGLAALGDPFVAVVPQSPTIYAAPKGPRGKSFIAVVRHRSRRESRETQ